ncbi:hypothetical protein Slin15195_G109290 [Septoria linicola]|uniref:Uncharacterized protein n=1 Tax=Septoria linicola TaxID=215465 RepID=A0A9Q9B3N3_9PEZI|nr:hypothetical protein Slin15195_G109290 [Septoria linicola]
MGGETRSAKKLSESVEIANLICQDLLETACEGQQEPSFTRHFWEGALNLFSAVVFRRLEQINKLQDTLKLSDEEVYDVVWRDTLAVSLRLEAIGLDETNAKLEFNTLGGPVMSSLGWNDRPKIECPRSATLHFLDSLGRGRNDMWTAYRQSRQPATLTLPPHLPRGLPFDCLVPVEFDSYTGDPDMPFLRSRAKDVVFTQPEAALSAPPTDEESTSAMGPFIEDYPFALSYYVSWNESRLEAATHAWQHAIGPLSSSCMSESEAFLFWSPIFSERLDELKLRGPWSNEIPYPATPELSSNDFMDHHEPLEWSPDPSPKAGDVKSRKLDPTHLDIMLERPFDTRDTAKSSLAWEVEGRVPGRTRPSYFNRQIVKNCTMIAKDTVIATALMYISAKNSQSPGILAAPFPSKLHVRYPALYLDGDFLDREDIGTRDAFRILQRLSHMLPPTLLRDLLLGILRAADQEGTRTTQDALQVLRILIRCDKPQMALQIVTQIILERPEDSSWQRAILIPGLFRSLSADDARAFLISLSTGIQDRLVEQTKRAGDSTATAPLIKVTTVKLLAQLLSGAMFIDQASTCQILIPILEVAKHIDIICAVMASLIDVLASTSDSTVEDIVLDALQQYAVPIMSRMDERRPISQDEWSEFEAMSAEMPEVYMEGDAAELPPVWAIMLTTLHRVEGQKRAQLFGRVLLTALRGSMQTNERWLKLFCRYIGVPEIELSYIPLKLNIVNRLFASAEHLPPVVADLWLEVFRTTFDPPVEVLNISQHVGMDAELRSSNAGRHWLSMFDETARGSLLRGAKPASFLTTRDAGEAGGLQISQIQSIVLQQADLIIRKAGTSLHQWTVLIQALAPPPWLSTAFLFWCQNAKPVLEEIIKRVDRLRTPDWQLNVNRTPAVLPDTIIMRLWLTCVSGDGALMKLLGGIKDFLRNIASTKKPFGERYEQVMTFARHLGLSNDDKIKIALDLGSLDGLAMNRSFDMAEHLRVDMAKQLIQGSQAPNDVALRRDVIGLICSWARSFDEDIRMVGLKLRNTALASVTAQKIGLSGLWYVDPIRD